MLLCLLGVMAMAGCNRVAPVVKVALVGPFEGEQRALGYDVIYSARLAVREINNAGGIGGYQIALVALDDSGAADLAQKTAASLVIDPAVVVVIGHWMETTTAAAAPIYEGAGLALLEAGNDPFAPFAPSDLPTEFLEAYAAVTPFDETAGPLAGPAYDAFGLVWLALTTAVDETGELSRESVTAALSGLSYSGLTGLVYQRAVTEQ